MSEQQITLDYLLKYSRVLWRAQHHSEVQIVEDWLSKTLVQNSEVFSSGLRAARFLAARFNLNEIQIRGGIFAQIADSIRWFCDSTHFDCGPYEAAIAELRNIRDIAALTEEKEPVYSFDDFMRDYRQQSEDLRTEIESLAFALQKEKEPEKGATLAEMGNIANALGLTQHRLATLADLELQLSFPPKEAAAGEREPLIDFTCPSIDLTRLRELIGEEFHSTDILQNVAHVVTQVLTTFVLLIGEIINGLLSIICAAVKGVISIIDNLVGDLIRRAWSIVSTVPLRAIEEIDNTFKRVQFVGERLMRNKYSSLTEFLTDWTGFKESAYLLISNLTLLSAVPFLFQLANTANAPALQRLQQLVMAEYRPTLLNEDVTTAAYYRGVYDEEKVYDTLHKLGYNEEDIRALLEVYKPLLPTDNLMIAYHRGLFDYNKLVGLLSLRGYDRAEVDWLLEISRPFLTPTDITALYRRGIISEQEHDAKLFALGYKEKDIAYLKASAAAVYDTNTLRELYLRRLITEQDHDRGLHKLGMSEEQIKQLKAAYHPIPPVGDLITMAVREVFTPEIANQFGQYDDFPSAFADFAELQGVDENWARRYWAAHWDLPSPQMGFEMLHRGIITVEELRMLLRALDIMPYWRDKLINLSYRPYTRVDVRRMYGLGVLNRDDVFRAYLDLGYDRDKAEHMTEFTVRYESRGTDDQREEITRLSRNVYEDAYRIGLLDRNETLAALEELGYNHNDANMLLEISDAKEALKRAEQTKESVRTVEARYIKDGYGRRAIGYNEAYTRLRDAGLSDDDARNLLRSEDVEYEIKLRDAIVGEVTESYVEKSIDREEASQLLASNGFDRDEVERLLTDLDSLQMLRNKKPSRSDLKKMYAAGLLAPEEYADELRGLGYAEKYITPLLIIDLT